MTALFVALDDELLPYVPATNQDFTPYLARARNHTEAIDKAFRFRLAFLRRLNEIKRVHATRRRPLLLEWRMQLQVVGVGEDEAGDAGVAAKDAFGSDELGQRTLDLLSSSLSAQTLKSYAGRLSQFAEFCHDSENISPLEATTATVVRLRKGAASAANAIGDGAAVYLGAPISHYPEWMTGALGRRREPHATLLERIASFGTSGYGCHHGAMRLLVVCAVRQTGFLSRMMPPSELDPVLEAVDAANISAAFSLLGLDAWDQSTPRMEAAIVQMSMPADFGGLKLALLQSEAPAAFYSAQSVVLPKLVREYGPALGPLYEAVRTELPTYWCSGLAT
eukprot:jgi/Tetstr1/457511/TSEL_044092.t1